MSYVMNDIVKRAIFEQVKATVESDSPNPARACLTWASRTAEVLRAIGIRDAQIQAGSVGWQIVPDELDDGVSSNQMGHRFDPSPSDIIRMMSDGLLPEMHCWVGIPSTGEVVDFTLGYQPKLCEELGLKWLTPQPDYFWGDSQAAAAAHYWYLPDMRAIKLCYQLIKGDLVSLQLGDKR